MLPRFHAPLLTGEGAIIALPPEEARHLTRVLRLGGGDRVAVFDGRGREFEATVVSASRDEVRVRIGDPVEPAAEPDVRLTLVQGVLKPDGMDQAIRDATMMGAAAVLPVLTSRSQAAGRPEAATRALDRWNRIALASAKQCRRATLPTIAPPQPFDAWCRVDTDALRLLFVEPAARSRPRPLREWVDAPAPPAVDVIVGPEGGWGDEEIAAAAGAGCVPVSLGRLTLRADAVPLAALTAVRLLFDGHSDG